MLFGFLTWSQTKIYIKCLFPDVDTTERINIIAEQGELKCVDKLTEFEHCLVAKMSKENSQEMGTALGHGRRISLYPADAT